MCIYGTFCGNKIKERHSWQKLTGYICYNLTVARLIKGSHSIDHLVRRALSELELPRLPTGTFRVHNCTSSNGMKSWSIGCWLYSHLWWAVDSCKDCSGVEECRGAFFDYRRCFIFGIVCQLRTRAVFIA